MLFIYFFTSFYHFVPTAITPNSRVWILDRRAFQQIMMRTGLQRIEENVNFLKSVPLLNNLSEEVLCKIADVLELVSIIITHTHTHKLVSSVPNIIIYLHPLYILTLHDSWLYDTWDSFFFFKNYTYVHFCITWERVEKCENHRRGLKHGRKCQGFCEEKK